MGLTLGIGAHHSTTGTADPMAAGNGLAQERQQALQIGGVCGGAEHQRQIRAAAQSTCAQLPAQVSYRRFQGGLIAQSCAAAGLPAASASQQRADPGLQRMGEAKRPSHGWTLLLLAAASGSG
jgi:hypothetical protein